ncbi:MAG: GxxExxY protein [Patescibacteria group bacterium]
MPEILHKELSYQIQGAFYDVYKTFRNAHKESVCHNALIENLINRGLKVDKNKRIDIYYQGKKVGTYIPDATVNDLIVIEIKCKPILLKSDISQFWHYLKSSNYKVGYLVNFGKPGGVEFIRRVYDTARTSAKQC